MDLRPSWVEIDVAAFKNNVRAVRDLVGPGILLYAVCKGDAYGCGIERMAPAAIAAGADAIAVGNPADVAAARRGGVKAPILLYGSTLPQDARQVAGLDVTVTIHDFTAFQAFSGLDQPVQAYLKVDTGMGRLGFHRSQWEQLFDMAARNSKIKITGLYTHFFSPEKADAIKEQADLFRRAHAMAEAAGLKDLDLMVASSRVLLGYPELNYTAVNPGRMLYGLLDSEWRGHINLEPVVRSVKSRLIAVKELAAGETVGYDGRPLERPMRVGIIPLGYSDGLPRGRSAGCCLVGGVRAPILGQHSMEHTVIDLTGVPGTPAVGDEVVLLGSQGDETITGEELAGATGLPALELLHRLAASLPRRYLD